MSNEILVTVYAIGLILQIVYGGIYMEEPLRHSYREGRKHGARMILASPIWPLVLTLGAIRGMFTLVRTAELTNRKDRQ